MLGRHQNTRERGRHGGIAQRRRGVRAATMASLLILSFLFNPDLVWAQAPGNWVSTRTAVGTLPLLAALGIGIVVAVGAVIAFLHMTAKGRNAGDYTDWADPGEAYGDEEAYNQEQTFTDHTIPLPRAQSAASLLPTEIPIQGPRLCGLGGDFSGLMFQVTASGLLIGRDPSNCQVVFPPEAAEVSRRHCTLQYDTDSQTFYLEDHGSSNGTFLSDGRRVDPGKRYPLHSGERFALSGDIHWFTVRI